MSVLQSVISPPPSPSQIHGGRQETGGFRSTLGTGPGRVQPGGGGHVRGGGDGAGGLLRGTWGRGVGLCHGLGAGRGGTGKETGGARRAPGGVEEQAVVLCFVERIGGGEGDPIDWDLGGFLD